LQADSQRVKRLRAAQIMFCYFSYQTFNMTRYLFFLLFLSLNNCVAQTPAVAWSRFAGTAATEYPAKILKVHDGFLIAARTYDDSGSCHLKSDIILIKVDTAGNFLWSHCFGGDSIEKPHDLIATSDGNFLIVAETFSMEGDVTNNHMSQPGNWGSSDFWVIKVDSTGHMIWQSCFGGSGWEVGYSAVDLTNAYMIFGTTEDSNDGDVSGVHSPSLYDIWTIKIDTSGHLLWQKCIGGSGGGIIESVVKISDDSIMLGGVSFSNDGDATGSIGMYDYWPVLIDSSGNILSQNKVGGSDYENCHSIYPAINGGFVMTGWTQSNDSNVNGLHGVSADYWVVRVDQSGNFIWQTCLGGTDGDEAFKIVSDGTFYYVVGSTRSSDGDVTTNMGGEDLWIVQLDSSGHKVWEHSFGGSMGDVAYDIIQTDDSALLIAGSTGSHDFDVTNNPGGDIWLVKLKLNYLTSTENINYNSLNIFPNPSDGQITIILPNNFITCEYSLSDITGKILLHSNNIQQNKSKINILLNLNPGIYFINFQSGDNNISKKIFIE
jgi:hypothetical protein